LKALDAPDWVKRGAYLNLLHHLPIGEDWLECKDRFGLWILLETVGVSLSEEEVEIFVRELSVGVEHIDQILRTRGHAKLWQETDKSWE
tara:strand:- start:14550 stop:14816 length:267 start_codon:yes stop_codon:yes gene_type:complete